MPMTFEDPVVTKKPGPGGDDMETERHPSYGQIGAARTSHGPTGIRLYGSDFDHGHYITIRINVSELNRSLNRDWYYGREQIIEVALSEAQWATFVSSPNVGSGVPCTIQHRQGIGQIPAIPARTRATDKFSEETKETLETIREELDALLADVKAEASGLSAKKRDALTTRVNRAIRVVSSTVPFVAKSFSEHMEDTVEHAKAEVHGYINHAITRAGLTALGSPDEVLRLSSPEKPDAP
jgi:hypothetical protein